MFNLFKLSNQTLFNNRHTSACGYGNAKGMGTSHSSLLKAAYIAVGQSHR